MQVGRGFTAARRQASRLAGLAGLKPCTHFCAVEPRRGIEGHAAWPGFYRRSATGLAARRSGRAEAQHPLLRGGAAQGHTDKRGALETLGNGPRVSAAFVPKAAARRQASRLTSLVWLRVACIVKPAIRRRASWLATKTSVDLNLRWSFVVAKIFNLHRNISSIVG